MHFYYGPYVSEDWLDSSFSTKGCWTPVKKTLPRALEYHMWNNSYCFDMAIHFVCQCGAVPVVNVIVFYCLLVLGSPQFWEIFGGCGS